MFLISSCSCLCPIHWSQGNEDVVGAAPTGDAPTTSELSTIILPKVRLILEVLRYMQFESNVTFTKYFVSIACDYLPSWNSIQLHLNFAPYRCWFQWLISRWILLPLNKCYCWKFKAELKIICVEFRIFFLFLIKMICSLRWVFFTEISPRSCMLDSNSVTNLIPSFTKYCNNFICYVTAIEQHLVSNH